MRASRPQLVIIGGGPGGMACGIWAARLGLRAKLLEASQHLGGQLRTVLSPVTDYPGIPDVDGPGLAARFVDHLMRTEVSVTFGCRVTAVESDPPCAVTSQGDRIDAAAIIIATGARRRRLGLERERDFFEHGVSYSVSKDREKAAGHAAVIVGGGDSAVEGAVTLAKASPEVHLVYRRALTARPDFVAAARGTPAIIEHPGRQVDRLHGGTSLEAVELDDGMRIQCTMMFVRIGVEPCTEFVADLLPCDDRGFLKVDEHQRCTEGIYAVGDVCSPSAMAVSVATGQAMIACKHLQAQWR